MLTQIDDSSQNQNEKYNGAECSISIEGLLQRIPLHSIMRIEPSMSDETQSVWINRNNKRAPSPRKSKKSNITLAIDTEIVDMLKGMAEGEGLSINSKINSILWKYVIFYRYVDQDSSRVIPSRSVNFFIENIDEEKWIKEYTGMLEEIVPFFS